MNLRVSSLSILVCLTAFLASSSVVHAATATWSANSEPNIAGYILSYGTQSGQHNIILDVGNVTTAQVALTPGQRYYFVVQAYNTSAQVSVKSPEVIFDAPIGSNRAPVLTQPANQSHPENATVSLQLLASDPDGNALTYSATGLPAALSVNPTTGLISGTLTFTSSGTYNVTATASDGALSNARTFTWTVTNVAQGPTITSLSRTSGAVGTAVTITGTNFGTTQGSSTVRFNGRLAAPTSWSATSIAVPVPGGATTGPVVVTVGGVGSNGVTFTVTSGTGTITLTQHRGIQSSGTSITLAFASNNVAGNLIVVAARASLPNQTFSITDTRGNTYRQAVRRNGGSDHTLAIYYAENIRAGANQVRVVISNSASLRFAILEYAGVATSNALDVTASATQSNSLPNSGNATTTASGDLLIGAFSTRVSRTFAAGSGYTIRQAISAAPATALMVEDRIQSTAGPVAANASLNTPDLWGAALAAFRRASSGATAAPEMMQTELPRLAAPTTDDFDGDGAADITVFRPANGNWSSLTSSTNFTASMAVPWGEPTDIPVPGDYDGDGKADVAMFRPATGMWHILNSATNNAESVTYVWGENGDRPMPADYDGDGKTDLAVFRPASGLWYILTSGTNHTGSAVYTWGGSNDRPIAGDYDGDRRADLAVYRASTGTWEILQSSTGYRGSVSLTLGSATDAFVPGDYDGDGKTDAAVFQPSTGTWSILESSTNFAAPPVTVSWGVSGDKAVAADYDGDGRTDIAVVSETTGVWHILKSSADYAAYMTVTWATAGDRPVSGVK